MMDASADLPGLGLRPLELRSLRSWLLATAFLAAGPVGAEIRGAAPVQWSGFGTVGIVNRLHGDAVTSPLQRDDQLDVAGAVHTDAAVDSALGVQLDLNANDHLRLSGQLLLRRRHVRDPRLNVETLFAAFAPTPAIELRAGRVQAPVFAVSQQRRIDIVHLWMRPPREAYGLALLDVLDGLDISGGMAGPWGMLDGTVAVGQGVLNTPVPRPRSRDVVAANLVLEPLPGVRLRAGTLQARVLLAADASDQYRFDGAGLSVDRDGWILLAEQVRRVSQRVPAVSGNGGYLMLGRQFGDWTPYGIAARGRIGQDLGEYSRRTTVSLGLRRVLAPELSLKLQLDQVRVQASGRGPQPSDRPPPSDPPPTGGGGPPPGSGTSPAPPPSMQSGSGRTLVLGVSLGFLF